MGQRDPNTPPQASRQLKEGNEGSYNYPQQFLLTLWSPRALSPLFTQAVDGVYWSLFKIPAIQKEFTEVWALKCINLAE